MVSAIEGKSEDQKPLIYFKGSFDSIADKERLLAELQ